MINYPLYDAIHEKINFTRVKSMLPPKVPISTGLYRTYLLCTDVECKLFFMKYKDFSTTTSQL